jgi:hypothetical protein
MAARPTLQGSVLEALMGAAYIDLFDNATLARIECKCALEALFRRCGLSSGLPASEEIRWRERPALGLRRVPISLVSSHLPFGKLYMPT